MTTGDSTRRHTVPSSVDEAALRLAGARVPAGIVAVAERLQSLGHAAVLVGGSVRDALLGLGASDWDLATSATPQEVQAAFGHTIPTGIEHGTVTVMVADETGRERVPVELTTFRGEGAYRDGRRPSSVTFHRDLREDLARRDFTVNAIAWDPIRATLHDPFDGLGDLRIGVLRAVGEPAARFQEDGLRTMRAVRLCATRQLALEPHTEAAIGPALPVLDKVSRERVHVELFKLLGAPKPSLGLVPMERTGMWPHVLGELEPHERRRAIEEVDAMAADPVARLARLLRPLGATAPGRAAIEATLDRLRPSRRERADVVALTGSIAHALAQADREPEIRRLVAELGRERLEAALAVHGVAAERADRMRAACSDVALQPGELSIKGGDLIAAGIVERGPQVSALLRRLLDAVWHEPGLDEPSRLLALADQFARPTAPRDGGSG